MTIDTAALQEFTDAELLKVVRLAIAEIGLYGQINTCRNKTIQMAQLRDLELLRDKLEAKTSPPAIAKNYIRRRRS